MLLVIAVFVYLAAGAELSLVRIEAALAGEPVARVMLPAPRVFGTGALLGEVAAVALTAPQDLFPIVDADGRLAGTIDRGELVRALAIAGPSGHVENVMRRDLPIAGADEPAVDVLRRLPGDAVVVDAGARPVGLVTAAAIERFAALRAALATPRPWVEAVQATYSGEGRGPTVGRAPRGS
jgi:stage IV sporulation protein FB